MAPSALKRTIGGVGPIVALALLLLASLALLSDATQNSERFSETYMVVLLINAVGVVTLVAVIGWNLYRLVHQVRERVPGARLTGRMVTLFVLLSVTPVLVVYYFSLQFLHRGIDSWFDLRIEQALNDSLELSRSALGGRMRERLKTTQAMASELDGIDQQSATLRLDELRRPSGASELTLMNAGGHIIASSSEDRTLILPHRPGDSILLQLRQSSSYIGLDPIADAGLHIRAVVSLPDALALGESRIVQALFPVNERTSGLADNVQNAYAKYRELAYLRKPLKASFIFTLSLVLLVSLFIAVWAAFISARRTVAPLRDLVQGTKAVADGDYETQLPLSAKGEVGFLVESFNEMTRKLAMARDETRRSQRQVEEGRTYLEAVLTRMSSGVVTLDDERRLFTANDAAHHILGVDLGALVGARLADIAAEHAHLGTLVEMLRSHLDAGSGDWREELSLFGASGRQVLMCRGTPLAGSHDRLLGHVLVFDDITGMIQAQKNAAWSEVARRLAHEIKNPLTPIQLSAERLRHKYLAKMSPEEASSLDRLTRTIVNQVEAMKGMVNAFSDYARSPQMRLAQLDLNALINDVLALYRTTESDGIIRTELDPALPPLEADPDRMRQVLHNLLKNAVEASTGGLEPLVVETGCDDQAGCSHIRLRVRDSGGGFPEDIIEHVFEPYVTTKPKGSGLGLAIVKKIVEEHGGVVWAENHPDGGASVTMRFPVMSASGTPPSPAARKSVDL